MLRTICDDKHNVPERTIDTILGYEIGRYIVPDIFSHDSPPIPDEMVKEAKENLYDEFSAEEKEKRRQERGQESFHTIALILAKAGLVLINHDQVDLEGTAQAGLQAGLLSDRFSTAWDWSRILGREINDIYNTVAVPVAGKGE